MLKLLKIEWMKLRNYRTFWVLSLLYLVSVFGLNFIVYQIQLKIYAEQQTKGLTEAIAGNFPYAFPLTWQMTSYAASYLLFLPGLLLIVLITNEFSYKTHRQNIIDGLSRSSFISVKLVLAIIGAILSTLMVGLTALAFGYMEGSKELSFEHIHYLGYFFVQALSYSFVAVLLGIAIKRGGLAIGIFFLYVTVLENLLAGLLNRYANNIGRYLPLESADNLIPLPLFQKIQKQMTEPYNYTLLLVVAIVYLFLFIFLSYRKFTRDDL